VPLFVILIFTTRLDVINDVGDKKPYEL